MRKFFITFLVIALIIVFIFILVYSGLVDFSKANIKIKDKFSIKPGKISLDKLLISRESTWGYVTDVIDGDTLIVDIGGKEYKVRYIGIDAPEIDHENNTAELMGYKALEINKKLVLGKDVEFEKDVSGTDKYGRLLRYVWIEGVMINEKLVREGYAQILTIPPDIKYKNSFIEAERYARNNNIGLWADR